MSKLYILIISFFSFLTSFFWANESRFNAQKKWTNDTPVYEVLLALGHETAKHDLSNKNDAQLIASGENIVKHGRSLDENGCQSKYVSKFFMCTSCHNLEREDPNLTLIDAEERLTYAIENKMPYLQGSTMWGIVNRETWYNDDYVKKYGSLVEVAKNDLGESIQLCATECAQGRRLNDKELESVTAYLWTLQIKMGDLELNKKEWKTLHKNAESKEMQADLIKFVKSKYMQKSPATFVEPPKDKKVGYEGIKANKERGRAVYELSCQHCHRPNGESDVILDNEKSTFRWLKRHLTDNTDLSVYQIVRHGTYAAAGHREYMPRYPLEKLSNQQVEDLVAYIKESAK